MVETMERDDIVYIDPADPPLNILTIDKMREMRRCLDENADAPVVVFRGTGKLFSAGVSVEEHTEEKVEEMIDAMTDLLLEVLFFPGVTVSSVHGGAYGGGCELALATDLAVAEREAVFAQPEIELGVFPPGAIAIFPLKYPDSWVHELVFSGTKFEAEEVSRLGILNRVFPPGTLERDTHEFSRRMASHSHKILSLTAGAFRMERERIEKRFRRVNQIYLERVMETEDAREGLEAFMEDRKPEWNHR